MTGGCFAPGVTFVTATLLWVALMPGASSPVESRVDPPAIPVGPIVDGPVFGGGELILPPDYREWIYVGGSVAVAHAGAAGGERPQLFTNVFVNPSAHRHFQQAGRWPDRTVLVLELRTAEPQGSVNAGGHVQAAVLATEVSVKDAERFADTDGWAYFLFSPGDVTSGPLSPEATCYGCHATQAAVDHTFVQFYPTLRDAARRAGTLFANRQPRAGGGQ
ncbi:MAG: cytochrome P460 family protein [Vicinamibacterales bacterium]